MAVMFSIVIVIEVLLTVFIAWGIMHEEKLVDFEDKIIFTILRKIRNKRSNKKMKTIITFTSTWMHTATGKRCQIHGKNTDNSRYTTFLITGHNPLPCYSFVGTYNVLVEWLEGNGWTRVFNTNVYVPDTVEICHK